MGTGSGGCVAVGIVFVPGGGIACGVNQSYDIALHIGDVIVDRAILLHGDGRTVGIVEEVENRRSIGFSEEFATGVIVGMGYSAYYLGSTNAVGRIIIGGSCGAVVGRLQSAAITPGEGPAGAVVVAGGITCIIVRDGLTIVSGKQIAPICVVIGVSVVSTTLIGREDITGCIVGVAVVRAAAGGAVSI